MLERCPVSGSAVTYGAAIEACAAGTTIADLVTVGAVSADTDACAAGAVSAVVAACTTVAACAADTAVACTAAVADSAVVVVAMPQRCLVQQRGHVLRSMQIRKKGEEVVTTIGQFLIFAFSVLMVMDVASSMECWHSGVRDS
jgi:hypothetical protein